jgi:hypothetical protein
VRGENVSSLFQLRGVGNIISGHGHRLEKGADDVAMEPVWLLGAFVCFVARERHVGFQAEAQGAEFDALGCSSSANFGVFVVGGVVNLLAIVAILLEAVCDGETAKLVVGGVGEISVSEAFVGVIVEYSILAEALVDGAEGVVGFGKVRRVLNGFFGGPFAAFEASLGAEGEPVVEGSVFGVLMGRLHCLVKVANHSFGDGGTTVGKTFPFAYMFDECIDGSMAFLCDGIEERTGVSKAYEAHVGPGGLQVAEDGICLDWASLDSVACLDGKSVEQEDFVGCFYGE